MNSRSPWPRILVCQKTRQALTAQVPDPSHQFSIWSGADDRSDAVNLLSCLALSAPLAFHLHLRIANGARETAPSPKNETAPRHLSDVRRSSCPSWARTRTLLIQSRAWRTHNSGKLSPNHKLRVSVCRSFLCMFRSLPGATCTETCTLRQAPQAAVVRQCTSSLSLTGTDLARCSTYSMRPTTEPTRATKRGLRREASLSGPRRR
jgi:hypothetical protein